MEPQQPTDLLLLREKDELDRIQDTILAIESHHSAVGITDENWKTIFVNQMFIDMFGYTAEELNAIGGSPTLHVNPEKSAELFSTVSNGKSWRGEVQMHTRSGQVLPIYLQGDALQNSTGQVIGFVGVHTDITELKVTEQSLKRRLMLERLAAQISARFINVSLDEVDGMIYQALSEIGDNLAADYSFIILLDNEEKLFQRDYSWSSQRVSTFGRGTHRLQFTPFAWTKKQFQQDLPVYILDVADLPAEAVTEKHICELGKIHSVLAIPLLMGDKLIGIFCVATTAFQVVCAPDEVEIIKLIGEMFINLLKHNQVETDLRHSKTRLERQVAELGMLNAIAGAGAEATDEEPLLQFAAKHISETLYPSHVKILILDEENNRIKGYWLYGGTNFEQVPQYYMANFEDINHFSTQHVLPADAEMRHSLYTSISSEHHLMGYLITASSQHDALIEEEENILKSLAGQLATAIIKIRSLKAEHHRRRDMEVVTKISSTLRSAETTDKMIAILVNQIAEVTYDSKVSLYLLENDLFVLMDTNDPAEDSAGTHYFLSKTDEFHQFIQGGQPLFINLKNHDQYTTSPLFDVLARDMSCGAIIPLMPANILLGLIKITRADESSEFSVEDQHVLNTVAEIAGNALRRATVMESLELRVDERTRHISALYDLSKIANEPIDLLKMLDLSLRRTLVAMKSRSGFIHLYDKEKNVLNLAVHHGIPPEIIPRIQTIPVGEGLWKEWLFDRGDTMFVPHTGMDDRLPDLFDIKGFHNYIGALIHTQDDFLGVVSILGDAYVISAGDAGSLEMIAVQIGTAVANNRLRKQAEELAVVEERQRLARDLHDSVAQSLYSVMLMTEAAHRLADTGKVERSLHYIHESSGISLQALKEMRLLIYELRPSLLEDQGLLETLRQRLEVVEKRAGMQYQLFGTAVALPVGLEDGLYRIAIEALNNVLKHANASVVQVNFKADDGKILLEVTDDGCGFDLQAASVKGGVGLKSMRERSEKLGGKLTISSTPGSGTLLRVIMPMSNLK
jgi:PAS domain S-box-containing protein